jgi:hypothetical protein
MIISCPQGSPEWHYLRLGTVTGTGFAKVLCKGKGRGDYMDVLVEELRTMSPREAYVSTHMEHGTAWEPIARLVYEAVTQRTVDEVGFIIKDDYIGISPDGLVGDCGAIEIKCPLLSTHQGYIEKNRCPPKYKAQVQGILWVTGRKWCDFMSYCPTAKQRVLIVRVERDESYIRNLENETNKFVAELKEKINGSVHRNM